MPEISQSSSLNFSVKPVTMHGAAGHDLTSFNTTNGHESPYYTTTTTRSGHIIDYNDTPGNENIMIRHRSGRGINIQPDGKILISSDSRADVVDGNYELIIENNGNLTFGNLKINVTGDFDLNVGGSFNLQAQEKVESISGNSVELVQGSKTKTVIGSNADTITGTDTRTALGSQFNSVKGTKNDTIDGTWNASSKDTIMTSEGIFGAGANDVHMAGNQLSISGGTGEIGGGNLVYSGLGANFTQAVTAPTFIGSLNGKASYSAKADQAAMAGMAAFVGGGGTGGGSQTLNSTPPSASASADAIATFLGTNVKSVSA